MITLNKNEFVENLERALSLIEDKDYNQAHHFLNNAIELYDQYDHEEDDLDLTYLLNLAGNISLLSDKVLDAQKYFEMALNNERNSSLACSGLGDVLFIKGDYQASKIMYEWGVKNDPENKAAVEGLAKVNKLFENKNEESMLLNSAGEVETNNFYSNKSLADTGKLIEEAYDLFNKKNFKTALNKLLQAEKLFNGQLSNPDDKGFASSFYNMKGFNYLGLNDVDNARASFEKALKINPASSQACTGLGEILFLTGNDEQAKTMYEWAVRNNNENLLAVDGLKKVNRILGLAEDHISFERDNSDAETSKLKFNLNEILKTSFEMFGEKKYQEAIVILNKSKELFYSQNEKELVSAFENLKGLNYLGLNNQEKASKCFETALDINPVSSQAFAGLGELQYLNNNDKEAKKMFEKALKYNPVNLFAAGGLSKVNQILGLPYDHSDLDDNFNDEDSLKLKSTLNEILESAFELFGLKFFDEAIDSLNKSEELFYSQNDIELTSAFENLKGFNYLGLDNKEAARESFETALNINPKSSQACAGLAELFYLEGNDKEAKTMYEYAVVNNSENQFAISGLEKVNKILETTIEN